MDTDIHDLVLIHVSGKPSTYARVEAIDPDIKRGWLRLRLLILTVPLQVVTWILEPEQIDGKPFTMGGTPVRLERVIPPVTSPGGDESTPPPPLQDGGGGKVISLRGRRKNG